MASLEQLVKDLNGPEASAARQRLFHLALATLVGPGLPLGLLYALTRPAPVSPGFGLGLLALALVLSGAAFYLVQLGQRDVTLPPQRRALSAAIGLASVPAVPLLLTCAFLFMPLLALGLGVVGFGGYLLARRQVVSLN